MSSDFKVERISGGYVRFKGPSVWIDFFEPGDGELYVKVDGQPMQRFTRVADCGSDVRFAGLALRDYVDVGKWRVWVEEVGRNTYRVVGVKVLGGKPVKYCEASFWLGWY